MIWPARWSALTTNSPRLSRTDGDETSLMRTQMKGTAKCFYGARVPHFSSPLTKVAF